jgi:hypothetical protein
LHAFSSVWNAVIIRSAFKRRSFSEVTIYNNAGQGIDTLPEGSADVTADGVVGQNSFSTNGSGNALNQLNKPIGVSADNGQLFIADQDNYRVLVYNSIPTETTNPLANFNLGTGSCEPTAANNFFPGNVQALAGVVNVSDGCNGRVLQFACQSGSGSASEAAMARNRNMEVRSPTPTYPLTATPTITPTYTISPTPSVRNLSVAAVPNVSQNGEPIRFEVRLPKHALVRLAVYSILGECVYQTTFMGNVGQNRFDWKVENQYGQLLASGLYIYFIETDDGSNIKRVFGKLAILH